MKNGLLLRYALLALALLPATVLSADQPNEIRLWPNGAPDSELYAQAQGEVEITANADREQPSGWPIIVELTMTNVGKEPIIWFSPGPEYPGAEHFIVQVRQDVGDDWRDVKPTNGQLGVGSSWRRELKPGESINVPLTLPVEKKNECSFRILPRGWRADKYAEISVLLSDDPVYADRRRVRMIEQPDPFWCYIAERYADAVVIEAMLGAVMEGDALIVAKAARVLARQVKLPEGAGGDFADLVRRWFPESPRPELGGLRLDIIAAALKTQSEEARNAVLDAMRSSPDARSRWFVMNALRTSPGDSEWLRRARTAIIGLQKASPGDIELAEDSKRAVEWIDSRLEHPEEPQ